MSASLLSSKLFKPVPPQKGSFPLDHDNVCKEQMVKYMKCLKTGKFKGENCREEIKNYLECRMDNNLMAKESWESLGLKEFEDKTEVKSIN